MDCFRGSHASVKAWNQAPANAPFARNADGGIGALGESRKRTGPGMEFRRLDRWNTPMEPVLPEGVEQVSDPGGRAAYLLQGPGGRVRVTRLGAHIQSWAPLGRAEVLFLGSLASYGPGVATRGGIPIVFPWFGDRPGRPELPAHGFARIREWTLIAAGPGPSLTLGMRSDAQTEAAWPHVFEAELRVSVETVLEVTMTVRNTGAVPFEFEEALHTYFAVGEVRTATVHGLEGVPYVEQAKRPQMAPQPDGPVVFEAETDRVFQDVPDGIELRAPALERVVELVTKGARSAIVWNPWSEKGSSLGQLEPTDWETFVCVESANCKTGAVTLGPGESHRLDLQIRARMTGAPA